MSTDTTTSRAATRPGAASLLEAGAILAPEPAAPPGTRPAPAVPDDADSLTARTYRHTVLAERPVVRLVPGTLGEAEDLALDFLGLVREEEAPVVGRVRRETLGFPSWALVNDPANGHHALALVKDVERLGRQAKSRAGAAKEGFEALGDRLGRAVPHFLPTYYEQVARIFLQHENPTYAAAFFGKARTAERVHGLEVDEERQRAVFLEFAFAGALTVKALREYVRDLVARLDPAQAWDQFRRLLMERCAAGMPPYASLPQDVRSLIRGAGLDRDTAEQELVGELLSSPGIVRAPASFWTAYRSALVSLAHREPGVRARLLEFFPAVTGGGREAEEFWLALLHEAGAESLLTVTGPAADGDGADPAGWLGRWEAHRRRRSHCPGRCPATLALVERMAERLRADARPVELFQGRWRPHADLDLLDLCLERGIPVTGHSERTGQARATLELSYWLGDTAPGARPLAALTADPVHRSLLHEAIDSIGTGHRTERADLEALASHRSLGPVLREWLTERAADYLGSGGLPSAQNALQRIRPFRPVVRRAAPETVTLVERHDVVPLLTATLRAGILDELGWPALDEAYVRLAQEAARHRSRGAARAGWGTVGVTEAWPYVILSTTDRAVVVGPAGVLFEHEVVLPSGLDAWVRPQFRWADGELLVAWWQDDGQRAYWSSRPGEVFRLGGRHVATRWGGPRSSGDDVSLPLPGGGRATGGRALHAGDTELPEVLTVIGDGTGYWREGRQAGRHLWLEYDPVTGERGRSSLPGFLRSGVQEGTRLVSERCQVLPLQPGLEDTPFGTDGTVLGRWVRRSTEGADGRVTAGTPDGRVVSLPAKLDNGAFPLPVGALRMPGGAAPVVALVHGSVHLFAADSDGSGGPLSLLSTNGRGSDYAAGTPCLPPLSFWHALRPRDTHGSAALRDLTDRRAEKLLEAVAAAEERYRAASRGTREYTGPTAWELSVRAVADCLPEATDPRLLEGVTGIVRTALRLREAAARYVTPPEQPKQDNGRRTQGMFFDHAPRDGDDATLREAVSGLAPHRIAYGYRWHGAERQWSALRQILSVHQVLAGRPADGTPLPDSAALATSGSWRSDTCVVPGMGLQWHLLLDALHALAYRAASPCTEEPHREALLQLLETVAGGPLADPRGTLREVTLLETEPQRARAGQVLRDGARTVVVLAELRRDLRTGATHWLALDHDPSGVFGSVAHFTLTDDRPLSTGFAAERLTRFSSLVREKGPAPWQAEAPGTLHAATGIGSDQAVALLSGITGRPDREGLARLGLKARAYDRAQERLAGLPREDRLALFRALLPDDPADLWTRGPDVAAATDVWKERLAAVVRLPEELDADVSGVRPDGVDTVLNPGSTSWLVRTTPPGEGDSGCPVPADPSAIPGRGKLRGAVEALWTLAYVVPYGHPLRRQLPVALKALRKRLSDPELLLDLDVNWTERGGSTAAALRTALGMPEAGDTGDDGLNRIGDALVLRPWQADYEMTLVRTAGVGGPDDPVFGLLEGVVGPAQCRSLGAVREVLGEGLCRTVHAGLEEYAEQRYAQDPTFSVPDLVAEVSGTLGAPADAAALYLMLLALPDPTDRDCVRWTGWKPARMKRARAELAGTGLVVQAKRARAGRGLFLPCGWHPFSAPALPVETWKEKLYPLANRRRALPHTPVPELFHTAWGRVRDGDAPAYEELTTRATRKGRRR